MQSRRIIAPVLAACLSSLASAQEAKPEDWEGKSIKEVRPEGFRRQNWNNFRGKLECSNRPGLPATRKLLDGDVRTLWQTGLFEDIDYTVTLDPSDQRAVVTLRVKEYEILQDVQLIGVSNLDVRQLKLNLRLGPGDRLNPALLKQDREKLREEYVKRGYHFMAIREELAPQGDGVVLQWNIFEGPMVGVDALTFAGNDSISSGTLEGILNTKENGWFSSEPFIEHKLKEDIERIKLYYWNEGFLDIHHGERVFVESLRFSEDKTRVSINIRIEEGPRYKVRKILARGNKLFTVDEIKSRLSSKEGEHYTEVNVTKDIQHIREKYGERAYIATEINAEKIVGLEGSELDLLYEITENEKQYVGRIVIQGNTKTKDEVIRRELRDFVPGEECNLKKLQRGIQRLRDRGWFNQTDGSQGILQRTEGGDEGGVRDILLEVKEGQTGNLRFAGGFSSSFGIMGIIELTQRNFDIADLPKDFAEVFNGDGFSGAGQFLRLRVAPAARRQSYLAEFKEPYLFGTDYGLGLRASTVSTIRESYDESRTGGGIVLDRRWNEFRVELGFDGTVIRITDLDADAPQAIKNIAGTNSEYSLVPALAYDSRDSVIFPTEGVLGRLAWQYTGGFLPGDFDFWKLIWDSEYHISVFETENKLKHVLSFAYEFGWMESLPGGTIPLFDKFFAGGRSSIRGFRFRGVGPMQNNDPVGGQGITFGTIEYSFPLFVEVLRGAVFYDILNIAPELDDLDDSKFRNAIGFGIRFIVPQLGSIPIALDFGFPLTQESDDERQTVTFDIGKLF